MNKIFRDYCVFSRKKDLQDLYTFKHFPIYMGCTKNDPSSDIFEDMHWYISESTGSIQLNPLLPLDLLYSASHNASVGHIWDEHHQYFAKFISEFNRQNIFEIGGSHGALFNNYLKYVPDVDWTSLEPNPGPNPPPQIKIIKDFLTPSFRFHQHIDTIVHSHVFEHAYDPIQFIEQLHSALEVGGIQIFSVPNMHALLSSGYTNCLNFEHTIFLSEPFIETLLENKGFEIIKKHYYRDHSIFYACRKQPKPLKEVCIPNRYLENKKLFEHFIHLNKDTVAKLNHKIEAINCPIYIFGAHIFTQYLLNLGLNVEKVVGILDNNHLKTGSRLYGSPFLVENPTVLKDKTQCAVILKAANYSEEIKTDILRNINPYTIFLD